MKEIAIFLVIAAALITLLAGLVWLLGASFGLNLTRSWWLAYLVVVFCFPAILNIHAFVSGSESAAERRAALIRGTGMLVIAATFAIPLLTTIRDRSVFVCGLLVGVLMRLGAPLVGRLLTRK